MRKYGLLFGLLVFVLSGCVPSHTRILWHDGKKIDIYSQGKSMVSVKIGGDEVSIDGRTSSLLRTVAEAVALRETQPNR